MPELKAAMPKYSLVSKFCILATLNNEVQNAKQAIESQLHFPTDSEHAEKMTEVVNVKRDSKRPWGNNILNYFPGGM